MKDKTAPPFIADVWLPHGAVVDYLNIGSNWIKLRAYIMALKPTEQDVNKLRLLMAVEFRREIPRKDILTRLHWRFNRLRADYERAQIEKAMK